MDISRTVAATGKRVLSHLELLLVEDNVNIEPEAPKRKSRKRNPRPDYTQTSWWRLIHDPEVKNENSRQHKYFRRRFRLPFALYEVLLNICYDRNWFPAHKRRNPNDENGIFHPAYKNAAPLELKLLGALRILGRGGPFDDLYDGSGIHENTHRTFFIKFCDHLVSELYNDFIYIPEDEDLSLVNQIYQKLGFPGCVGSVDVVHIWWDMCPFQLKASCTGKVA
jgi:hypothetical protein